MTDAKLSGSLVERPAIARLSQIREGTKRRGLVLTDEAARHPFRAKLAPHVCKIATPDEAEAELDRQEENLWKLTTADVRGAVNAYVATFAAVLVFIS